MGIVGDDP